MSVSLATAELSLASSGVDAAMAKQPPQVHRLYRQLQLAGVEPVLSDQAPAETYLLVGDGDNGDRYWAELWKFSAVKKVHTAFGGLVIPQCPLLSAERALAIVSPVGLQVPEESAWVTMRIDLARFAPPNGVINERALQQSLETCVDVGEKLHDVLCWPTPDMRHDAWLNRRLAIVVVGLGDLLRIKCFEPGTHDSLRFLNQLLLWVRATLQSRSRAIAAHSEQLPAITLSDPSHNLPCGGIREDWQRRWREAVQASLVRHRNLLALSPWSLFPANAPADFRYAELLPLLRHADACAFNKTVSIAHWNLKEFKCFHQRAKAVLQQRGATSLIADHV